MQQENFERMSGERNNWFENMQNKQLQADAEQLRPYYEAMIEELYHATLRWEAGFTADEKERLLANVERLQKVRMWYCARNLHYDNLYIFQRFFTTQNVQRGNARVCSRKNDDRI